MMKVLRSSLVPAATALVVAAALALVLSARPQTVAAGSTPAAALVGKTVNIYLSSSPKIGDVDYGLRGVVVSTEPGGIWLDHQKRWHYDGSWCTCEYDEVAGWQCFVPWTSISFVLPDAPKTEEGK